MKNLTYLLIVFSLVFFSFTLSRILLTFLGDFEAYYVACQHLFQNKNPYSQQVSQFAFIYPPASLFFLCPVAFLPFGLAEKLWTIISTGALISSIYLMLKTCLKMNLFFFLFLISLATVAFPTKFTLGMGQINLIILGLLSLTFFNWRQNRPFLAGAILAVATAIKLTPVFMALFFLRKKAFGLIKTYLGISLVLATLAVFFFGPGLTRQYFREILPGISVVGNSVYYNQALTGFLSRLKISNRLAFTINYFALAGLLLVSFFLTKSKRQTAVIELTEYGLLITASLIAGGLTWQHHFVLLAIPYVAVFLMITDKTNLKMKVYKLTAFLSYFLVAYNIKNPQKFSGPRLLFLSHGFYGAGLLYVLTVIILKKLTLSKFENRSGGI